MAGAGSSGPRFFAVEEEVDCLARGAGYLSVPAFSSDRVAENFLALQCFADGLGPDLGFQHGTVAAYGNDLHERRPFFDGVEAIWSGREEREVDVRRIGVGVDDTGDAFKRLSRAD